MPRSAASRALSCLVLLLAVSGCTSPYRDRRILGGDFPADFALEVYAEGDPGSTEAGPEPVRYVVESNRRLHALRGPKARMQTFPPYTRPLTYDEFRDLYHLAHAVETAPRPAPAATGPGSQPAYAPCQVDILAFGRRHPFSVDARSPAAAALLVRLAELQSPARPGWAVPTVH